MHLNKKSPMGLLCFKKMSYMHPSIGGYKGSFFAVIYHHWLSLSVALFTIGWCLPWLSQICSWCSTYNVYNASAVSCKFDAVVSGSVLCNKYLEWWFADVVRCRDSFSQDDDTRSLTSNISSRPPSLDLGGSTSKRSSREVGPLSPSGYQQPPTPDHPPPSPSTALLGIQLHINPKVCGCFSAHNSHNVIYISSSCIGPLSMLGIAWTPMGKFIITKYLNAVCRCWWCSIHFLDYHADIVAKINQCKITIRVWHLQCSKSTASHILFLGRPVGDYNPIESRCKG